MTSGLPVADADDPPLPLNRRSRSSCRLRPSPRRQPPQPCLSAFCISLLKLRCPAGSRRPFVIDLSGVCCQVGRRGPAGRLLRSRVLSAILVLSGVPSAGMPVSSSSPLPGRMRTGRGNRGRARGRRGQRAGLGGVQVGGVQPAGARVAGATSKLRGATSAQMAMACGQRGWKRQPGGGTTRLGGAPRACSDAAARRARGPARRDEQQLRIRVLGLVGDVPRRAGLDHLARVHHHDRVGQVAGGRDVVGDVEDREPSRSRRSLSRLSRPSRIDTSSIETGSSASRTCGSTASARAMATRWRWPPDSSCGYLRVNWSVGVSETRSSRLAIVSSRLPGVLAVDPQRPGQVIPDVVHRVERGERVLQHQSAPGGRTPAGRRPEAGPLPPSSSSPDVGGSSRASTRASVDLPDPLSPTTAVTWARGSATRDVLQGVHHRGAAGIAGPALAQPAAGGPQRLVHREVLGDVPGLQQRRVRRRRARWSLRAAS